MHRTLGRVVGVVVASVTLLVSAPARADVVPAAPTFCPPGHEGIGDHSGSRCEAIAPKDCPPGWNGLRGGTCTLATCTSDAQCGTDGVCAPHSVCLMPSEDRFYNYDEKPTEPAPATSPPLVPGSLLESPALFAGPPALRVPRSKPIVRYRAVNLCSPEIACTAPSTCQTEKLCVPKNTRALAYRGKNIQGALVPRQTDVPLTTSAALATEGTSPIEHTRSPAASGCSRCGATPGNGEGTAGGWVAVALGALLFRRSRGRRCPTPRGAGAYR